MFSYVNLDVEVFISFINWKLNRLNFIEAN